MLGGDIKMVLLSALTLLLVAVTSWIVKQSLLEA
jgi:hypothetical protein